MKQLSTSQRALVASLTDRLRDVPGVRCVVLGGSHARGNARPDSDIDLGLYYAEAEPVSIDAVRRIAQHVNDTPEPVVTDLYDWGPWVNGGSWLTIHGQRVDFLYRNLDQLRRVLSDTQAGHQEHAYAQYAPYGFFSDIYLGDLLSSVSLADPKGELDELRRLASEYPAKLRAVVVRDQLWSSLFAINASTDKFAKVGDAYGTAACLSRVVNQLVRALFALNRTYLVNDPAQFREIARFERAPSGFAERVQQTLGRVGDTADELVRSIERIRALVEECIALSDGLCRVDANSPAWIRAMSQAGMGASAAL